MIDSNVYLLGKIGRYSAKELTIYSNELYKLKLDLINWAGSCYLNILDSGSRAKGTAIMLASDVDFLISLSIGCNINNGGLREIYESLYTRLNKSYNNVRKQNVSVRLNLNGLEVDVTPARRISNYSQDHNLYASKQDTWKQTNIATHIKDISLSGRLNEIKLLKIWRELNQLDFPSIYLEYLIINNILIGKHNNIHNLADNFWFILNELAKSSGNPLYSRVVDPANSNNILSELLTVSEKVKILNKAKESIVKTNWQSIIW